MMQHGSQQPTIVQVETALEPQKTGIRIVDPQEPARKIRPRRTVMHKSALRESHSNMYSLRGTTAAAQTTHYPKGSNGLFDVVWLDPPLFFGLLYGLFDCIDCVVLGMGIGGD